MKVEILKIKDTINLTEAANLVKAFDIGECDDKMFFAVLEQIIVKKLKNIKELKVEEI